MKHVNLAAPEQIGRAGGCRRAGLHHVPRQPVAQLTAVDVRRKRIDPSALRAVTDAMPMQPESARDFVRRMRDDERS